jgi:hypothetical protein
VDRCDPHALSEVMTGAVYGVFLRTLRALARVYDERWEREHTSILSAREKRVAVAASDIARFVIGALDYLPPGEASFADFGRAMVNADRVVHPADERRRRWLVRELVRRGVVSSARALTAVHPLTGRKAMIPPADLIRSARLRRRFFGRYRAALGIPAGAPIDVLQPRIVRNPADGEPRRLFLRVRWTTIERHRLIAPFRRVWRFTAGATVVLDCRSGKILAALRSDGSMTQRIDRGNMLRRWALEGVLATSKGARGPDGRAVQNHLVARTEGAAMRITGGARLLHIARPE